MLASPAVALDGGRPSPMRWPDPDAPAQHWPLLPKGLVWPWECVQPAEEPRPRGAALCCWWSGAPEMNPAASCHRGKHQAELGSCRVLGPGDVSPRCTRCPVRALFHPCLVFPLPSRGSWGHFSDYLYLSNSGTTFSSWGGPQNTMEGTMEGPAGRAIGGLSGVGRRHRARRGLPKSFLSLPSGHQSSV